jgi:hypothetical protein
MMSLTGRAQVTRLGRLLVLIVCLGSSVLHGADVRGWEGTVELPTYVLGAPDPNPAFPLISRHNIYPYTMLDDLTDRRKVRTYGALFLENEYLRATILPELGGRLYSLYDKVARREVFCRNHVVKYGLVGLRGAWISGGVEFNFPNGHTTLTVSPVAARLIQSSDGSATVVVGAVDWVSGMHWEVALTLRPGQARFEQHVTLANSTALPNLYWYWANAAIPATEDMQFIYPMREANPHSFTGATRNRATWTTAGTRTSADPRLSLVGRYTAISSGLPTTRLLSAWCMLPISGKCRVRKYGVGVSPATGSFGRIC